MQHSDNNRDAESLKVQVLISSLVDSEDIAPSLKAVFRELDQDKFVQQLNKFQEKKESDIENLCHSGFEDFVVSVRDLLKIHEDVEELRESVEYLNGSVQSQGSKMIDMAEELGRLRVLHGNLSRASMVIKECQSVLALCVEARKQTSNGKFYSALKLLGELRKLELRRMSSVQFGLYVEKQIPVIASFIRDNANMQFNNWLVELRDSAERVGRLSITAITSKQKLNSIEDSMNNDELEDGSTPHGILQNDERLYDATHIDFSPLFRCIHIYQQLGLDKDFQTYYKQTRRQQAALDLKSPPNFLALYEDYVYRFAGFFIIEEHIQTATGNLETRSDVDAMWENALGVLIQDLLEIFQTIPDSSTLRQLRASLLNFCATMKEIGFSVKAMSECLDGTHDRYLALTLKEAETKTVKILEDEDYTPMVIVREEEYEGLVRNYNLQMFDPAGPATELIDRARPQCFSKTIPKLCQYVKEFCVEYCNYVKGSKYAVDISRRALDQLFVTVLGATMGRLVKKKKLDIAQSVQVSCNSYVMAEQSKYYDNFIQKLALSQTNRNKPVPFTPQAAAVFLDVRSHANDNILHLMIVELDKQLKKNELQDWTQGGASSDGSPWAEDTIVFLRSSFASMSILPSEVQDAMYHAACNHISSTLMRQLTSGNIKKFTLSGIEHHDNDIKAFEDFADSLPTSELRKCFARNRQLVDLFVKGSPDDILNPRLKEISYPALESYQLISVLEKFVPEKMNMFGRPATEEGAKLKRAVDAALKGLKESK